MNLLTANPRDTTFIIKPKYADTDTKIMLTNAEKDLYISAIDDIRYLVDVTRFEISFSTSKLTGDIASPTKTTFNC